MLVLSQLIWPITTSTETWNTIQPSDFVEVRGVFRPNPLADSLRAIDKLFTLFMPVFSQAGSKSKGKSTGGGTPQITKGQELPLNQIKKMIEGILSDVENEQVKIFVVTFKGYSVVTLLFVDYLRDQRMIEISHREYRLLGKVVRKIQGETNESIDLLRNTGLGAMGKEAIQQLVGSFSEQKQMNLPEVKTEILGPALEIVPIAIFV